MTVASAGEAAASSPPPDQRGSVGTGSTVVEYHPVRLRPPRSLPPWIDSYEVGYGSPPDEQLRLLQQPPPRTIAPQHNSTPTEPKRRVSKDGFVEWTPEEAGHGPKGFTARLPFLGNKGGAERGRKWDHLRSAEPVIVPGYMARGANSAWSAFVHSSEYGHMTNEDAEVVGAAVLDKLQPHFNDPVDLPRLMELKKSKRARTARFYKRVWNAIMRHPLVPLAFRLTVLLTSVIALALSVRIFIETPMPGTERTQAIVAIVIDCVAIPYICYMTWDEYTGRPLGLRSATQKISLVLMDLFFIIFKASSTTLAFETLVENMSSVERVMHYTKALAAFQLIGLISWTMTFTVNVFRLVQRLGGGDDEGSRL